MDSLLFRSENRAQQVHVTFWGGEPLLAFDLLRSLVLYARSRAKETGRSITFGVPTNLTLMEPHMLEFLLENRVGISLSLDGDERAQGHRRFRDGASTFSVVMGQLADLRHRLGSRMPGVRMTVSPGNVADLLHNVRFFLEQGLRTIYLAPVVEAAWTDADLSVYESEQRRLVDSWIASLHEGRPWHPIEWNKALLRRRVPQAATHELTCGAGRSMLAVDVYGDIFPCHRFVFYDKSERGQSLGHVDDVRSDSPRLTINSEHIRCRNSAGLLSSPAAPCARLCPALNFAMCGNVHHIHERLSAIHAVEARVIEYLEGQVEDDRAYQRYVEKVLLPFERMGARLSSTALVLSQIDDSETDELVSQAEAVLKRLQRERRKNESP